MKVVGRKTWVTFQSVTFDVMSVADKLRISTEIPIYLECKLNEPMYIAM